MDYSKTSKLCSIYVHRPRLECWDKSDSWFINNKFSQSIKLFEAVVFCSTMVTTILVQRAEARLFVLQISCSRAEMSTPGTEAD